jgi:hypothetical protein
MRYIYGEALGICEHCGTILDITGFPSESMDADWICPNCKRILSHLSFGYDKETEDAKRVKWVGPGGKWVDKAPNIFKLDGAEVIYNE